MPDQRHQFPGLESLSEQTSVPPHSQEAEQDLAARLREFGLDPALGEFRNVLMLPYLVPTPYLAWHIDSAFFMGGIEIKQGELAVYASCEGDFQFVTRITGPEQVAEALNRAAEVANHLAASVAERKRVANLPDVQVVFIADEINYITDPQVQARLNELARDGYNVANMRTVHFPLSEIIALILTRPAK